MRIDELRGRFLIDTNVLIYATLEGDPRYRRAQQVIKKGADNLCEAFISVQHLAEMYPNLTGPKTKPPDSPELARKKISSIGQLHFLEVLPTSYEVVTTALELCCKYELTLQVYFDMQLVATMLVNQIPTLITENDKDFSLVTEISAWNPF